MQRQRTGCADKAPKIKVIALHWGIEWNGGEQGIGGGRGIRTPETVSRLHALQACAFNHSATPPRCAADYSDPSIARKRADIVRG